MGQWTNDINTKNLGTELVVKIKIKFLLVKSLSLSLSLFETDKNNQQTNSG